MSKSGPIPKDTEDTRVTRQRVDAVQLADSAIEFPDAPDTWLDTTADEYEVYCDSAVARAIREEDLPGVRLYFDYLDQLTRGIATLTGNPEDDKKKLDGINILNRLLLQHGGNLGIGPLNRVRLGIAKVEERSAIQDFLSKRGDS